jgi:exosortase
MSTVAAPATASLPQFKQAVSWRAVLGLTVIVLAHLPLMWRYIRGIIDLPHYEFVMLLPIGSAVLLVPRIRRLGELHPGRTVWFLAWMAATVALFLFSVILDSPWFGAISTLLAAGSVTYAVGGKRLLLVALPAWGLLWLGIRLPMQSDERLALKLQDIAAHRASAVMNYLNQDHILDGNVVETPVRRYMVEEACSGVQSLFAITACTVFFALWMREPVGRVILLMLVAWWWVWMANVVRVIAVTVLNSRWSLPVDDGWGHDALTVFLFTLTLGLIVSSEHLLLFFLPRGIFSGREKINQGAVKQDTDYGPTRLPSLSTTWLASPLLVAGYLGLIALEWLPQVNVPGPTATPTSLGSLQATLGPPSFNGWVLKADGFNSEQRRADSQWGAYSQTWRYGKGAKELVVSIDYPFRGFHELTICYRGDGWDMAGRKVIEVPRTGEAAAVVGEGEKCVEAILRRPEEGNYAYLLFTSFNDRQQALPVAEQLSMYQRLVDRLKGFVERMRTLGASGGGKGDQVQSFQLQVIMQGPATPTKADGEEALAMFTEFRTRLGQYLAAQAAGGAQP